MFQKSNKSAFAMIVMALVLVFITACGSKTTAPSSTGATAGESAKPAATAAATPAAATKPITLKMAHIYTVKSILHEKEYLVMQKLIEEKSKGRIKVELYPTEQLGSAFDMVDLVKNGVADIGTIVPAYWPDKFPVNQVYGLPGMFDENWVQVQAMWKSIHQGPLADELKKAGLVPLTIEGAPIPEFLTKSKKVEKPEDLKGLKIRSTGGVMDQSLKAVGAIPVQMPLAQIYENIDRGTLDGVSMNYSLAGGFNIQEVAKYMTDGGGLFAIGVSVAAMNADKYNALPDDLKQIIYEAGKEASITMLEAFFKDNDDQIAKFKAKGVNFVKVSPDFRDQLKQKMQPAYESYTKVLDSRGMKGKDILDGVYKDIEDAKKVSNKKVLPDFK